MEADSVAQLLQQLEEQPSVAANALWNRFIERLIRAADRHLRHLPRRAVDEEDVALSAFHSFLRGAQEGRFRQLATRDDLWQVLAMLTERKAIREIRRETAQKRGGGAVRGESVFMNMMNDSGGDCLDQVGDPSPAAVEHFTREVRELLESLDDDVLREIALRKLEGYTNQEVATQLNLALRTIERKLHLIRCKWEHLRECDD